MHRAIKMTDSEVWDFRGLFMPWQSARQDNNLPGVLCFHEDFPRARSPPAPFVSRNPYEDMKIRNGGEINEFTNACNRQ